MSSHDLLQIIKSDIEYYIAKPHKWYRGEDASEEDGGQYNKISFYNLLERYVAKRIIESQSQNKEINMTETTATDNTAQLTEEGAMIHVRLDFKKKELTEKLNKLLNVDVKLMCVLEENINDTINMTARRFYIDGMLAERKAAAEKATAPEDVAPAVDPHDGVPC